MAGVWWEPAKGHWQQRNRRGSQGLGLMCSAQSRDSLWLASHVPLCPHCCTSGCVLKAPCSDLLQRHPNDDSHPLSHILPEPHTRQVRADWTVLVATWVTQDLGTLCSSSQAFPVHCCFPSILGCSRFLTCPSLLAKLLAGLGLGEHISQSLEEAKGAQLVLPCL